MFMKNKVIKLGLMLSISFSLFACSGSEQQTQLLAGEEIAKKNCKVCHAQGLNGAPIIGNKKMWASRIEKGRATLVANAINGVGLMPPKGGKTHVTDEENIKQKAFLTMAFGGPNSYTGKDMREAHAGMALTEEHFGAVAEALVGTLEELNVPQEHIDSIVGIAVSVKADVLNQ